MRTILLSACLFAGDPSSPRENEFVRGLSRAPNYFPIAVWLQDPKNADRYRAIGVNLYVGLWRGPTAEQLDRLDKAGLRVICGLNEKSRAFLDRPTIAGWMHGDEPDNAQSLGPGKGYGPPIKPMTIVNDYAALRQTDPSRPVLLNLGQGVAWDGYHGRGVRTNHPEDYPEYLKGCDIASFDIYPAVHDKQEIAGNLWYVPKGVERLRRWTDNKKPVWSCIETTRISNVHRKPTPAQVRTEVWMALIHGAKGLIYFAHEFKPRFIEAGLLADAEMAREVTAINRQIHELAPTLNGPEANDRIQIRSSNPDVPIATLAKRGPNGLCVFAVAMRDGPTSLQMQITGLSSGKIEVLGENRSLASRDGKWTDEFAGYQVHLYRVAGNVEN